MRRVDSHHRNSLPMNRRASHLIVPRIQIIVNDDDDEEESENTKRGSLRGRKYSLHRNWPNPPDNDDDDYYANNDQADYIDDINNYDVDEDSDPRFEIYCIHINNHYIYNTSLNV